MARVTSIYKVLKFVVECQEPGRAFFEVIAAFNSADVAIGYAKDCPYSQDGVYGYRYRVTERKNNEPKCIYRSDANAAA